MTVKAEDWRATRPVARFARVHRGVLVTYLLRAVVAPTVSNDFQRKGAKTPRARDEAVGLKEPSETSRHRKRAVAIGVGVGVAVAVVEVARGKPTSKQPQRRIRKGVR